MWTGYPDFAKATENDGEQQFQSLSGSHSCSTMFLAGSMMGVSEGNGCDATEPRPRQTLALSSPSERERERDQILSWE